MRMLTGREIRDWASEIEDAIQGASDVHAGINATLQEMRDRADEYDDAMKDAPDDPDSADLDPLRAYRRG